MLRSWMVLLALWIPNLAGAAIVHPLLRAAIDPQRGSFSAAIARTEAPASIEGSGAVGVWVRTRDGGRSLEASGLLAAGRLRDPRIAFWTRDQIRRAAEDPSVLSLMPAVRCEPSLDSSLVECGGDLVHDAQPAPPNYSGLTGSGVVIGIIDSGIDLQHEDFRFDGGATRLVSLWDQTAASTDPPRGFSFGKEWTAAQIDAGLSAVNDPSGHGTHVAGIAAGSGRATGNEQAAYRYVGMAPNASIVVVKTDYMTTSVADAVDYVFQKADSLGLPAVANLSLGTHYGAHDGTDDFSLSLASLAGPGHAIVAAAGNEMGKGYHARRIFAPPDTASVSFSVPSYTPGDGPGNDEIDIDGWYTAGTAISFILVSPNGHTVGPVGKGATLQANTPDGRVEIDNSMTGPGNGEENVFFWIYDLQAGSPPASGTWRILMQAEPAGAAAVASTFDAWTFYRTMPGNMPFLVGADEGFLVASPASGDSVIAVGSYATKAKWFAEDGNQYGYSPTPTIGAISTFSSIGPRRDGLIKPDVVAPGQGIGAALSSITSVNPYAILLDGKHVVFQGTSMACPHVTGLTALIFENLGRLSARALGARLRGTARRDAFTGPDANPSYGFGKIDVIGATGYAVPVLLETAEAHQEGSNILLRFVLSLDAGTNPFEVYREGPGTSARVSIGWTSSGRERLCADSSLTEEGDYRYWLRVPAEGTATWAGPVVAHFVPILESARFAVGPNPFVDRIEFRWSARARQIDVEIHDFTGRRIRQLRSTADTEDPVAAWDGRDENGRAVPAGVYLARLRVNGGPTIDRKILRLR